jgi:hypothetical protein
MIVVGFTGTVLLISGTGVVTGNRLAPSNESLQPLKDVRVNHVDHIDQTKWKAMKPAGV